jgi:LAO/AO transport system kinase
VTFGFAPGLPLNGTFPAYRIPPKATAVTAPASPNLSALTGKAQIASALSAVEANPGASADLLDEAFENPRGYAIGITGPPGAGKSTLINALIAEWRRLGKTVAVLAVDPSSKASGGALLGDRVRMRADPADSGVFIRSIAARGRLGGLADIAYPAAVLLRARYDRVIVESVGVGQSETDISLVSDTVVLCIQPASGDSLQFMKAGIAEIPDIAVVTKADMGAAAIRALADLKGALSLAHREENAWRPECLSISSTTALGLGELFASFHRHENWLADGGRLAAARSIKAQSWIEAEVLSEYGRKGLAVAGKGLIQSWDGKPFTALRKFFGKFTIVCKPDPAA